MSSITVVFLILSAFSANRLEIGGFIRIGNLGFQADRPIINTSFTGSDFLYSGSLHVRVDIPERFRVEAGYYRDIILRNTGFRLKFEQPARKDRQNL